MEAISSYELGMIFNQIKEYDVIGIDEGQFVGFSFYLHLDFTKYSPNAS